MIRAGVLLRICLRFLFFLATTILLSWQYYMHASMIRGRPKIGFESFIFAFEVLGVIVSFAGLLDSLIKIMRFYKEVKT